MGPELRDQGGHSGQPPQGIRLGRRADQLSLGGPAGGRSESGEPGAAGGTEEALGQRRGELQIRELLLLIETINFLTLFNSYHGFGSEFHLVSIGWPFR